MIHIFQYVMWAEVFTNLFHFSSCGATFYFYRKQLMMSFTIFSVRGEHSHVKYCYSKMGENTNVQGITIANKT